MIKSEIFNLHRLNSRIYKIFVYRKIWYFYCAIIFLTRYFSNATSVFRPNIIFIMADDMGWNDVSFHGSDQILTPNIDALAYNGIILNHLYTQPVCTPSRAAFMTGKYPIHLGMQGNPIYAAEPVGLPLNEKTLADYLKDLGYTTRAVGKWHLGFYKKEYTPCYRGFHSFYGYYGGFISYFTHILQDVYKNIGEFSGYDLRRNEESVWEQAAGQYATDLFTKEAVNIINEHDIQKSPLFLYVAHLAVHAGNTGQLLEAPVESIQKFQHIIDPNRRVYAGMISKLDDCVGEIMEALENKQMLHNTIIILMSDNGAPSINNAAPDVTNFPNWGSNFPFRGAKGTLWEGAVRSPALIWSAALQQNARVSTNLMHMTDWLPTLYSAAGGDPENLAPNIDGINQWYMLTLNLPSKPRTSVLLNIDEKNRNAAIRVEDWKLIIGSAQNGKYDGYYGNTWDIFEGYSTSYNVSAVIDSKSGKAITTVANNFFMSWANEYAIKTRRYQATIKCESTNLWDKTEKKENEASCQTSPCLFNIVTDPCEKNNVAKLYPAITTELYNILKYYRMGLIPQISQPVDAFRADPKLWNNTWSTWIN